MDSRRYSLEVAVQPPALAKAGVPLYPPLVVRVHIHDASGAEITGEDELSGLFAQTALYQENGNGQSIAPPDVYLLSGRLSQSLDLLDESGSADGGAIGNLHGSYALFPDLTINKPGNYRLGVSLFKVEGGIRIHSSDSGLMNGSAGGGTTVQERKTNVVIVQEDSVPTTHTDAATQELLDHLRSKGAEVPSPPHF
ncbi:hypothetical protein BZA77DRAFT_50239 [Pyronema omphalodes]|nr:hypothetical protein BZA77DRAFT_50239 [Pyronema omphalodes]